MCRSSPKQADSRLREVDPYMKGNKLAMSAGRT